MRAADILPDDVNNVTLNGVSVRKGTVGALLNNARVWADPMTPVNERTTAENDIVEAVPALRALGLFNILEIRNPELRALVDSH